APHSFPYATLFRSRPFASLTPADAFPAGHASPMVPGAAATVNDRLRRTCAGPERAPSAVTALADHLAHDVPRPPHSLVMDSDFDPHHRPESLAVLWVTASSRQRIGARLCTSWVVCLADTQGGRRPWPDARRAARELHAWACRPGEPVAPSAPLARLEAAASEVGPGLTRRVIEIAVDSCHLEAAQRSGRGHVSSAGMEA